MTTSRSKDIRINGRDVLGGIAMCATSLGCERTNLEAVMGEEQLRVSTSNGWGR
ncbi:homoserine dehydrogenase [Sesbania bispinosa]|nr:homoserine dehydrogenase [Sesbania bispinosa]